MPTSLSKKPLSSIKLKVSVAIEATAGTKPTSGYYRVPMVTALPDMDWENDTIDVTSYDNEKNYSYIPGLRDTGGLLSLEANWSEYGISMWDDLATLLDSANNSTGKCAWLMIDINGTDIKYFIPIIPVLTGIPDAPVNDKVSINYNFTVVGDMVKETIASISGYYASGDYTPSASSTPANPSNPQ